MERSWWSRWRESSRVRGLSSRVTATSRGRSNWGWVRGSWDGMMMILNAGVGGDVGVDYLLEVFSFRLWCSA